MLFILAAIAIDAEELHKTCRQIEQEYRIERNILTQTPAPAAARNWDIYQKPHHYFSHELTYPFAATAQKNTGRCWIFSSLGILRGNMAKKFGLKDFEFSASYLFFHDKIEKANLFLEKIIETRHESLCSQTVQYLLNYITHDGGAWNNFVDLVEKYGLVPKSVYPENESCNSSFSLNRILEMKLSKDAEILRKSDSPEFVKEKMMKEIYQILVLHMGAPPKTFDFQEHKNLTPWTFRDLVLEIPLKEYITLVHSPRKVTPLYSPLLLTDSNNMVGGAEYIMLNLPIKTIKEITKEALLGDFPVSFAADAESGCDRVHGVFDTEIYDYESLYHMDFSMEKGARLEYDLSTPSHLMTFTGVHIEDGEIIRWKVENTWGIDAGKKGFFSMSDNWFDEYVFFVVVPKKYLPDNLKELLNLESIILEPWDPLWQSSF